MYHPVSYHNTVGVAHNAALCTVVCMHAYTGASSTIDDKKHHRVLLAIAIKVVLMSYNSTNVHWRSEEQVPSVFPICYSMAGQLLCHAPFACGRGHPT